MTWSPTLIRMKFLRIFPEIWASTSWPFGKATRNIVPGRTCVTAPLSSIGSSLATATLDNGLCQPQNTPSTLISRLGKNPWAGLPSIPELLFRGTLCSFFGKGKTRAVLSRPDNERRKVMSAQAGDKVREGGEFHCEKCHQRVRVHRGAKLPRCPNCGNPTFEIQAQEESAAEVGG